ncbi:MAG: group 1 truncated hemoglobin [Burkholderiales bacterium]|nr:group 1 truncated hemoglobin [Burkholderiales bacterium]
MNLSNLRFNLTPEKKRHVMAMVVGTAVSWSVAGLMACSSALHAQKTDSLYQQLGGVAVITQVSDRTMDRVATDPRTKRTFEGIKLGYLKQSVAAYLCKVADGPCAYEGETMANSHADLKITGSEFDLMVETLREEINQTQAPNSAKNELLRRLAPTRRDIVKNS